MSLHHLVVDLNSSLAHMRPPSWAVAQLRENAPPDWLATVAAGFSALGCA